MKLYEPPRLAPRSTPGSSSVPAVVEDCRRHLLIPPSSTPLPLRLQPAREIKILSLDNYNEHGSRQPARPYTLP